MRLRRTAAGTLNALLFYALTVTLPDASAQERPQIRAATVALAGNRAALQFDFEWDAVLAPDLVIESTSTLSPPAPWEPELRATITEQVPGAFQVVVPMEAGTAFYRILVRRAGVTTLFINEVMSRNRSVLPDANGLFHDWIEIYNASDAAVELEGYGLSDNPARPHKWKFPESRIQPGGFLVVFASGEDPAPAGPDLHASFRVSAGGEPLVLSAPDRSILDRIEVPPLQADHSAGRWPDGSDAWYLYGETSASPGAPNPAVSLGEVIEAPRFAPLDTFFPAGQIIRVEFDPPPAGRTLRYTLDGSPVSTTSAVYTSMIALDQTTVVRAAVFDGDRSSAESVRTCFIGVNHTLPILSLAAEPGHFGFRDGYLYGMGNRVLGSAGQVLQNFPFSGSHAWQDREVAVAVAFYDPNGRLRFQNHAGLKIFGGWGSRGYPQKSFALFARARYGAGKFQHQVFPEKPIDEFENLVLRNSGNDNQSSHQTPPRPPITAFGPTRTYGSYFVNGSFTLLRDAMMQRLVRDLDLDTQAYRPAVLYINGEYWGIYNLREKINENYIIANHGTKPGGIDLIEGYGSANAGDAVAYREMRDFIANRDMRNPANLAHVEENFLEAGNFIDYHLAVIYFQNFDIGNIKCWRPRAPGGRFRWIVYDQDYGFNLWNPDVYVPAMARDYADYDNMFRFYTAAAGTGTGWPNAGGRTLLLRRLLTNEEFKSRFVTRCADLLNTAFREERVLATIDGMAAVIRPEIGDHLQRWSWTELRERGWGLPHQEESQPFVPAAWEANLEVLRSFAQQRPEKLRRDCMEHFALSEGLGSVTLSVSPAGAGQVRLNSLDLAAFPWSGVYFRDYPINVNARPAAGYRFVRWERDDQTLLEVSASIALSTPETRLTAIFEALPPSTVDP